MKPETRTIIIPDDEIDPQLDLRESDLPAWAADALDRLDELSDLVDRTSSRIAVPSSTWDPRVPVNQARLVGGLPRLLISLDRIDEEEPEGRMVAATPHAEALAKLSYEILRIVGANERIGEAVHRYQESRPAETEWGLLQAVIADARLRVEERAIREAEEEAFAELEAAEAPQRALEDQQAADRLWATAGLPGPPRATTLLFTPEVGVQFNQWSVPPYDMVVYEEHFTFTKPGPMPLDVFRAGRLWAALPRDDDAEWPEFPEDWEMSELELLRVAVDALPGTWSELDGGTDG